DSYLPLLVAHSLESWGFRGNQIWTGIDLIDSRIGAAIDTPLGQLRRTRSGLLLQTVSNDPGLQTKLTYLDGETNISFGRKQLRLQMPCADQPVFGSRFEFYLDADQVQFPLTIRRWQVGDRMQPYGMQNQKKLSDIFIDEKYTPLAKQQAVIFEDQRQIICLSGFRIADSVKISPTTKRVLKIVIES
ncbi:MAG: tRNA lysidine(34) synthetase TilS, partial [Bacteroidota bacterium]